MENKAAVVMVPYYGNTLVRVSYFMQIPIYSLVFLDLEEDSLVIFVSPEGDWQEDGIGVTARSQFLGNCIASFVLLQAL